MVKLRLSRVGKKNHHTFKIIVSDRQKDTLGTYLELLGTYDPHQTPTAINLKEDRVKYWLSVGAQPSSTVHNLLVEKGLISAPKLVIAKAKPVEAPAEAKAETPAPAAEKPAEAAAEAPTPEAAKPAEEAAPADTPAA